MQKPEDGLMFTCSCCGETKPANELSKDRARDGSPEGGPMCQRCSNKAWDEYLEERARLREERETAARPPKMPPRVRASKQRLEQRTDEVPSPGRKRGAGKRPTSGPATRAETSRENGRRGGRPPKWKPEVRKEAGQLLRAAIVAGMLEGRSTGFKDELLRLARALEDGKIR